MLVEANGPFVPSYEAVAFSTKRPNGHVPRAVLQRPAHDLAQLGELADRNTELLVAGRMPTR
ncbi:hypothetical protein [Saccharopolyspora hattusasensis]|uniref:hypothetical protein n=1 Tax=Saccharopolyspora hattusasensis TaxID=1128679 RepID=UPI003D996251